MGCYSVSSVLRFVLCIFVCVYGLITYLCYIHVDSWLTILPHSHVTGVSIPGPSPRPGPGSGSVSGPVSGVQAGLQARYTQQLPPETPQKLYETNLYNVDNRVSTKLGSNIEMKPDETTSTTLSLTPKPLSSESESESESGSGSGSGPDPADATVSVSSLASSSLPSNSKTLPNSIASQIGTDSNMRFKPPLPWPMASSYAPWSFQAAVSQPVSCEAYFGAGYTQVFDVVPPATTDMTQSPPLRCYHNPLPQASICLMHHVSLHNQHITMNRGGETMDSIMGRREEDEMPKYSSGALQITLPSQSTSTTLQTSGETSGTTGTSATTTVSQSLDRVRNINGDLLRSVIVRTSTKSGLADTEKTESPICTVKLDGPVYLMTRYEYANLFHTSTDWYNAWSATRMLGQPRGTLIFIDAHCESAMDEAWKALFANVIYAKHFGDNAVVCMERAILIPTGYQSPLEKGINPLRDCKADARVREFSDMFVRAFDIEPYAGDACDRDNIGILFVRRVHYLAHPRHNGKIVRRIENEDEILAALQTMAAAANNPKPFDSTVTDTDTDNQSGPGSRSGSGSRRTRKVTILNGLFSSMTVKEQVAMAQNACMFVGAHGAGLSHILFAPRHTRMLELQTPGFERPHFEAYSHWMGGIYEKWLTGTNRPDPQQVVQRVTALLNRPL
jgi:glycoprotein 2-beta-D-xylosyltransferase